MAKRWLDLGAVGLASIVVVAAGLALRTEATDVSARLPTSSRPPFEPLTVTVKKDTVIGIRLDQTITTETARVDDTVTARVSRDVVVDDRAMIPAGTRFEGLVTLVERGAGALGRGKLGIRFCTLVLSNDTRVSIHTDTIFREGDSAGEPAPALGASAALGAMLSNSGRQTAPNATSGAPALATSGHNDARLPAGSPLTVKLTAPLSMVIGRNPD